jgi:hypothetical protein
VPLGENGSDWCKLLDDGFGIFGYVAVYRSVGICVVGGNIGPDGDAPYGVEYVEIVMA